MQTYIENASFLEGMICPEVSPPHKNSEVVHVLAFSNEGVKISSEILKWQKFTVYGML